MAPFLFEGSSNTGVPVFVLFKFILMFWPRFGIFNIIIITHNFFSYLNLTGFISGIFNINIVSKILMDNKSYFMVLKTLIISTIIRVKNRSGTEDNLFTRKTGKPRFTEGNNIDPG